MISKGRNVNSNAILTKEDVVHIRANCNLLEIAKKYGVTPRTIYECVDYKTWV